jgi:PAS domain S-box-containing protein
MTAIGAAMFAAGVAAAAMSRRLRARPAGAQDDSAADGRTDGADTSFRTLVENSDLAMQILRPDGSRLLVNRACARLFGFERPEELLALSPFAMVAPEDRETMSRAYIDFIGRGVGRILVECETLTRDGGRSRTETHLQQVRWNGEDSILQIHFDVTQRLRAADAVRQSEERLNNAQRIARFGSWDMWLDTGRLEISEEGLRMLGLEKSARPLRVGEVLSRFHPDDIATVKRARAGAMRNDVPYAVDYRIVTGDGETRFVRECGEVARGKDGRPERLSGVVQDVTELRRAQDTLWEQENFYRELIGILPDTIYIHVDNRIVMANAATVSMFGADSLDDILGLDPDTLVHPEDVRAIRARRSSYTVVRQRAPYTRFRYRRLDGSYFEAESCSAPIIWQGKSARLIINRDIASRLEAEGALRDSESRLKEAQRIAMVGDWEHDLDAGTTLWSDELYRILGTPLTEAPRTRQAFIEMVHPEDREALLLSMSRTEETGRPVTSSYRVILPNGDVRHLRTTREHLPGENGLKGKLRGITQDVTEQTVVEADLRESEKRFRDLVESSVQGVMIRNLDGERRYVNRALLDMFGFESVEEALNAPPRGFVAPYERERVLLHAEARLSGGDAPQDYPVDCIRADGTVFPAHFYVRELKWMGEPAFHISVFDLTDLKHAERALRASEENFREMVENSHLGVMIRRRNGERVYFNRALVDMIGYESADYAMKLDQDAAFVAPHDRDRVREYVYRRRAGDSRPTDYEADCIRTDGVVFPAHFYVRETEWMGEPVIYTTLVDLTDVKRAEQEVQKLNQELEARVEQRTEQLRQAQSELVKQERLATLGQLTATVSHELRNPLGAMRNSLYVVRNRVDGTDSQLSTTLDRIDRNITRCDGIIEELLDYTRIRTLAPVPVTVDAWIEEVLDEHPIPPGVTLRRDFGMSAATVYMDPARMRRAVVNALENALQTVAEIAPPARDRPPEVTIGSALAGDRVEITIRDNGPGIPSEIGHQVFEPLFSTRNFGVGLGLPVIRQIMEQHDGGVTLKSVEGAGTTVILWFPASFPAPAAAATGS